MPTRVEDFLLWRDKLPNRLHVMFRQPGERAVASAIEKILSDEHLTDAANLMIVLVTPITRFAAEHRPADDRERVVIPILGRVCNSGSVSVDLSMQGYYQQSYAMHRDLFEILTLLQWFCAAPANPTGGIVGAKIYYYRQRNLLWYAGGTWSEEDSFFSHSGQHEIDDGVKYSRVAETDHACGCAIFVKSAVFREIGLLDERFFLTYEDTDLCYRARTAGYKSFVVPGAKVWHKVSTSMGGEGSLLFHYFMARNRLLWAEKNLPLQKRLTLYRRIFDETLWGLLSPRLRPQDAPGPRRAGRFRKYFGAVRNRLKDPVRRVHLRGFADYALRRFGDCPRSVRRAVR